MNQFPTLNDWVDWVIALLFFSVVWLSGSVDSIRKVVEHKIMWLANPLGIILIVGGHAFVTYVLFKLILTNEVLFQ
jgi:uncharacterized membrane protein YgdD (TMEM256/DUF423 family)